MISTKAYYPSGQLESEGFVNGEIQVGIWTFYHENGKVFSKGQFDAQGKPVGVWTEYYNSGQIKYEAISSQGNWFSLAADNLEMISYWTEEGISQIVDGNGKITTYFDNGNIQHVSYWRNRLKEGTLQEFYESGQLNIEREYKDGVKDGIGKVFSENGQLVYEYHYLKGKPIGKVREWYPNGQLAEEGEYMDGEYFIQNFWTEDGSQTLKSGTGKVLRTYGATGGDIYEQYYNKGKITGEKKIAGVSYGPFIPNTK